MPNRTKKERKQDRPSGSRWHNFHFSGKLILCSVIFGLMLVLIGGIIMAIGMDRDDDPKTGDYNDIQKKPPLVIVGPVIMGIGGFTTCVGIIMCLVETKVCRKKSADSNPLINGNEEGNNSRKDSETLVKELDKSPGTHRRHKKHQPGHHKRGKSEKRTIDDGKGNNSKGKSFPGSPSSGPISINSSGSKNFLSASDTFMTPPSSINQNTMQMHTSSRDAENQTSSSLIQSFQNSGRSWNVSADFQTPPTSFIDSLPMEQNQEINNMNPSNQPETLKQKLSDKQMHAFLTPQNSADILESSDNEEMTAQESSSTTLKPNTSETPMHEFLTPKNSEEILDVSDDEEMSEQESSSTGDSTPPRRLSATAANIVEVDINPTQPNYATKLNGISSEVNTADKIENQKSQSLQENLDLALLTEENNKPIFVNSATENETKIHNDKLSVHGDILHSQKIIEVNATTEAGSKTESDAMVEKEDLKTSVEQENCSRGQLSPLSNTSEIKSESISHDSKD